MAIQAFKPIHPFPARMSSELALEYIGDLRKGSLIADPMCGSGTVLRVAAENGHRSVGFDLDPLAVLMSRTWTSALCPEALSAAGRKLLDDARAKENSWVALPWVDQCQETQCFIERWFEPAQREPLRRLAHLLAPRIGPIADALRIVLSRTIVTKERGASVARDTSHSRPHKWFSENTYDVFRGFEIALDRLASALRPEKLKASVVVNRGDARDCSLLPSGIVDAVITSPPYLNAIDYLRGHRLALVWLGYTVRELRLIRAKAVGTEISAKQPPSRTVASWLRSATCGSTALPQRELGMLQRYAEDVATTLLEQRRVLKRHGKLIMVVGNSKIRSVFVENSKIVELAALECGFTLRSQIIRELPSAHRYLPIERGHKASTLENRMKQEVVLLFEAA